MGTVSGWQLGGGRTFPHKSLFGKLTLGYQKTVKRRRNRGYPEFCV